MPLLIDNCTSLGVFEPTAFSLSMRSKGNKPNTLDRAMRSVQFLFEMLDDEGLDLLERAKVNELLTLGEIEALVERCKRTPAMVFSIPNGLAGKVLKVRAAPSDAGFGARETLRFAPIAVTFLNASGEFVNSPSDSGPQGGPAESFAYSYAVWRQVTIPSQAVSAVFYADPALYGTKQSLAYQYGGLMPVAGILLARSANANAEYTVYGEFSAKVISAK